MAARLAQRPHGLLIAPLPTPREAPPLATPSPKSGRSLRTTAQVTCFSSCLPHVESLFEKSKARNLRLCPQGGRSPRLAEKGSPFGPKRPPRWAGEAGAGRSPNPQGSAPLGSRNSGRGGRMPWESGTLPSTRITGQSGVTRPGVEAGRSPRLWPCPLFRSPHPPFFPPPACLQLRPHS